MAVEDTPLSRRDRKAQRTRRDIVRAASDLVLTDGYERATINRIAERADLATRTVTTRFASKEEIFFEGTDDLVERAERHLRSTDGDVVDRLQAWLDDLVETASAARDDHELRLLRTRAIASDPDLQALRIQHFNRAHTAIAEAVARDTNQAPDAPGPQMNAAAAIPLLGTVERISITQPPEQVLEALARG